MTIQITLSFFSEFSVQHANEVKGSWFKGGKFSFVLSKSVWLPVIDASTTSNGGSDFSHSDSLKEAATSLPCGAKYSTCMYVHTYVPILVKICVVYCSSVQSTSHPAPLSPIPKDTLKGTVAPSEF